jgi:hypothetical protein
MTAMKRTTPTDRFAADPALFVSSLVFPEGGELVTFGDRIADHQREWLAVLAPAFLALAHGRRPEIGRVWIEGTKGSAKDTILAALVLWLAAFSRRPITAQVGAADQDQADELTKSAKVWLRYSPWLEKLGVKIQNNRVIGQKTDVDCMVIASEVSGSHGARPDLLILNEAHAITRWEFAQNLLDNASKMPDGLVICATNAGFMGSEAWKLREIARTSSRWAFLQFDRPAPWISKAELDEAARRNASERFKRLFHGVWSRGAGDALDVQDIEAAVDATFAPLAGRTIILPNGRPTSPTFVAGLDLGIKHDHSALVVLAAVHETRRIRLAHAESWAPKMFTGGKVDLRTVQAAVLAAHRKFGLSACLFDPWQASMLSDGLRSEGVRMEEMTFSGGNLNRMATTLLEVHRSRQVDWFPCQRLIDDVMRLRIVEKSYGHRLEATQDADGHSDLGTAYAICLPAAVDALNGHGPVCSVDFEFWNPAGLSHALPAAHINDRHAHLYEPPPPGAARLGGFIPRTQRF